MIRLQSLCQKMPGGVNLYVCCSFPQRTFMTNRSWSANFFKILTTPNTSLKWIVGCAVLFLAAVLFNPFLQGLFQFEPLSWKEILVSVVAGCLTISWFEVFKAVRRKKSNS